MWGFDEWRSETESRSERINRRQSHSNRKYGGRNDNKSRNSEFKLFINKQKPITSKNKREIRFISQEKVFKQEEFLEARNAYKLTLQSLEKKGVKSQILEQVHSLVKNDYTKKIEQLISISSDNQQTIIALI